MIKDMKKIFTILILFSLTMSVRAAVVDSGYCGGEGDGTNLSWELTDDGTLTISGEGEMADMSNFYYGSYSYNIFRVEILDGVTSIGEEAFASCSSLTSIVIPESVTSIGDYAFYGCERITNIEIPESVTSIGEWAFAICSSLTSIEIPESVTSIGASAFASCSSLTSIEIPEGVTSIGYSAFYGCERITNIEIPESVTSIGESAFASCSSLTSIVIPESVTSIGEWAFAYCSSLTSIVIPESVTSIGEWAFADCLSLTSIEIPESVTSIGERAFADCFSLENIISNNPTPPSCIGLSCFSAVDSDIPVYVPAESIDLYRNAEGWDYFTNFLPLEELGVDEPGGSAVEETEADGIALKITARDGRVYCEDEAFRIVNLAGQDVTAMNGELQGMYIVVSGDKAVKVVVR